MSQQPQPLVSPTGYVHEEFGKWCEENVLNPNEVMQLLLFQFLQVNPEQRVNDIRHMKADFSKFADCANFEDLQKVINDGVTDVQLALLTWLETGWDVQPTEI